MRGELSQQAYILARYKSLFFIMECSLTYEVSFYYSAVVNLRLIWHIQYNKLNQMAVDVSPRSYSQVSQGHARILKSLATVTRSLLQRI